VVTKEDRNFQSRRAVTVFVTDRLKSDTVPYGTPAWDAGDWTPHGPQSGYDLAIDVDFDEPMIGGTAQHTVRNTSEGAVRHIPLMLYRMMRVTDLTDTEGRQLRFT
jgi:hypothetical protein